MGDPTSEVPLKWLNRVWMFYQKQIGSSFLLLMTDPIKQLFFDNIHSSSFSPFSTESTVVFQSNQYKKLAPVPSRFWSGLLNIRSREEEGAGRGRMFICAKLRQNLSEIQDRKLERMQKVIWDHLLAFKGEIIQKQAVFSLPFRTPNNSRVVLIYTLSVLFFLAFSFLPRRGYFFV